MQTEKHLVKRFFLVTVQLSLMQAVWEDKWFPKDAKFA